MADDQLTRSRTRLLHVSDTHLGYIAYGKSRRADDFSDAFIQVVQLAIRRDVDAVVHTGDLTHNADASSELGPRIAAGLRRLRAEGIPFYFILGNHDITDAGTPQAWAERIVEKDLGTRLGRSPAHCGTVSLYGIDYQERSWWENPDLSVADPPTGTVPILCLHQSVSPLFNDDISDTKLSTIQKSSSVKFEVVLLGHSHYTNTAESEGIKAHYAGSTERTSRAYEGEPVGVTEFDISEDGIDQTFHELEIRPFATYTVNYSAECDRNNLDAAVEKIDIAGEVVTIYTAGGVDTQLVEQAFQAAGAFDTRSMPWDGNEEPPKGIAQYVETKDGNTQLEPVTDDPTSDDGTSSDTQRELLFHVGDVRFGREFDEEPAVPVNQAFKEVVDTAVDQSAAAIVITGALFDPDPNAETIEKCRKALERASEGGVSVILATQSDTSIAAIEELRQANLLLIASTDSVEVGPFSIHGLAGGQEFTKEIIRLSSEDDAACNIILTHESITPPCAPESAEWNYNQISDLIGGEFDALLLNSGSGSWNQSDRLLAEGADLAPPLDQSCFDQEEPLGGYAVIALDEGELKFKKQTVASPPVVTQEIAVKNSATYEEIRSRLDDLDIQGAHVRILLRGANQTVRTRVASELQRQAKSVVIWDEDEGAVTPEQPPTAPGTKREAVPGDDITNGGQSPEITPEISVSQTPEEWGRPTGPDLINEGFASVKERDGDQCGFVFDINAWESAHPEDVSSHVDRSTLSFGKWYCHHDATEGHHTCPFHTPNDEIDSSEVRSRFMDTIENANSKRDIQFYGASLPSLVLSEHELDVLQNYPVDIQHATVGHVRIEDSLLNQPIRFNNSTLENGVIISNTRVEASLSMRNAHIDGGLKFKFARLTESPALTSVKLDGYLVVSQTDLPDGIMLSGSQIAGRLRFSNCSVGGHATFYEIEVSGDVDLNRTDFSNECRYDQARVGGDMSLFDTSINQRFVLQEAVIGGEVTISQSMFGSEVNLSEMTGSSVAVRDSSLESTLICRQSMFNLFTLDHTTVDGMLRLDRTECGKLRFDTVTCLDHVEITGDCVGSGSEPKTVHDTLTVTNTIFHRPFVFREIGLGGACRLTNSVFHDEVSLIDATLEEEFSLAQSTVKGSVTLGGVLNGALELDNGTFEGLFDADGITDVGGALTASHSSFDMKVDLRNTTFNGRFDFRDVDIAAPLHLDGCVCNQQITFENSHFSERISLDGMTIAAPATFRASIFDGEVTLIDLESSTDIDFSNTRFSGRLTATGADVAGDLLWSDSRFAGQASFVGVHTANFNIANVSFADTTRFEHLTVNGSIDATGTSFEGKTSFDDATIDGVIDGTGATFDQKASFEDLKTLSTDTVSFTEARFFGPVSFQNASFGGELLLKRVGTWAVADFTHIEVAGSCSLADVRFRRKVRFCEATVHGSLDFNDVTAEGGVDFTNATLAGGAIFDHSRFGETSVFDEVESRSELSLTEVSFQDDVWFDDAKIDGKVTAKASTFGGRASFSNCEFNNAVLFQRSTFESDVRFDEAGFDGGASFKNAHLKIPLFSHTRCAGPELDFSGATLGDGQIVQPADDPTYYNFTGALLGNLTLEVADGSPIDVESFRFVSTRYDGFEFADHPPLYTVKKSLEQYAGPVSEPSCETLEKTYLKAKNGASMVGDSDAAGKFFVRELVNRAKVHWVNRRPWSLIKNSTLRATSKYGQSPARVIGSSIVLIVGFGGVFYGAQSRTDNFPVEPGSTYDGLGGAMLLSLESFTTLVFGGADVSNQAIRLVGAVEGFIGALMIALLLYALTQSIDR